MARPTLTPGTWGKPTLAQREDGRWQARVYYRRYDGVGGRTSATAVSRKGVLRAIQDRVAELVQAEAKSGPTMTFGKVVDSWLRYEELRLAQRQKSRGTHSEHLRNISRHLLPALGELPVREIGPRLIFDLYTTMAATHSPLARNVKSTLKLVLDHAIQMEWIPAPNPASSVSSVRRRQHEIFAPEVDQLRALREAIIAYNEDADRPGPTPSPLLLDVVDVMMSTGLRIGEVLGLRLDDVDVDAELPFLEVNGAVKEKGGPKVWEPFPKSESGRRRVFLDVHTLTILSARVVKAREDKTAYLFHTRTGAVNGPQDVHRALRRVRDHAGLPAEYVPHALRRSATTEVANAAGLESAAQFAGHKRSRITESHYAKRQHDAPDVRELMNDRWSKIAS